MTMIATMTMRAMIMGAPVVGPGMRHPTGRERRETAWSEGWARSRKPRTGRRPSASSASATASPTSRSAGSTPRTARSRSASGGTNRLTGQLAEGFWGASCDADEKEVGGLFGKAVLPTALLAKAHMPDLAKVVPAFNVESIEGTEALTQHLAAQGRVRVARLQQALHRDGAHASTTRSPCASSSAPASSRGRRR